MPDVTRSGEVDSGPSFHPQPTSLQIFSLNLGQRERALGKESWLEGSGCPEIGNCIWGSPFCHTRFSLLGISVCDLGSDRNPYQKNLGLVLGGGLQILIDCVWFSRPCFSNMPLTAIAGSEGSPRRRAELQRTLA